MSKCDQIERIRGSGHCQPQMKSRSSRTRSYALIGAVSLRTESKTQSESSKPRYDNGTQCPFLTLIGFREIKQTSAAYCNNISQQTGIRHSWKRKRSDLSRLTQWWALWLSAFFLVYRYPAAGDVLEGGNAPLLSNSTLALAVNFQPSVTPIQPSSSLVYRKLIQNSTAPTSTRRPVSSSFSTRRPSFATSKPTVHLPTRFPTSHPLMPPTIFPSVNPFTSPSKLPSDVPSSSPSLSPSQFPSSLPTYSENLTTFSLFTQQFDVAEVSVFDDNQVMEFETLFERYTESFGDTELVSIGKINTTCAIIKQILQHPTRRGLRDLRTLSHNRYLLSSSNTSGSAINTVQYSMTFNSFVLNVTNYPDLFRVYVTQNLQAVVLDLRNAGLNVTNSQAPLEVVTTPSPTFMPTVSHRPSPAPSFFPSVSPGPSSSPSSSPTHLPTINTKPTASPSVLSHHPSNLPSMAPSPPVSHNSNDTATVVAVSVAGGIGLILIALFVFWYLRRKRLRESAFHAIPAEGIGRKRTASRLEIARVTNWRPSSHGRTQSTYPVTITTDSRGTVPYPGNASGASGPELISPSDSLASHQSMLSVGNSMGPDSVEDEPDATQNLADEFDQYKDQNLEKMRADVEGNLSGFDGMMSQALTKALMEDDELNSDPKELLWGGHGKQSGIEIEASALCEVNDWLKRMENATLEESRGFMQEVLNKMVASVRHGVLGPKEASRAVHECAALLGLQLASEIPGSTLVISGLRKTSTAEDVIEAFRTFGEIEEAAVASNQRGFAVVRYISAKSVDRALHEYRTGEIVVQDVAVQVKVLKSEVGSGPPDLASPAPAGNPEFRDALQS